MRKNFGSKPYTYPQPVFIIAAYGENGQPNAMNAAWGGISDTNEITLCLSNDHKTTANLLMQKAFTVAIADKDHVAACDYLGMASGNEVPDKLAKAGFTVQPGDFVPAPVIQELPMTLECRLKSYQPETGRLVGEIVNVSIDETYLTADGSVDVDRMAPITFDPCNNTYRVLGDVVGQAFSDGLEI